MTTEIKGFGGRVLFEVTGNNMKMLVVASGMNRAVPEWSTFSGNAATLFDNLSVFLARTKTIRLIGSETDEVVSSLIEFWEYAAHEVDYRKVWNAFLFLDPLINDEWIKAIQGGVESQLKAPEIVRPNAPSDEVLELQPDGQSK